MSNSSFSLAQSPERLLTDRLFGARSIIFRKIGRVGHLALHDRITELRKKTGGASAEYQGVSKEKIRKVLAYLHLGTNSDLIDGVFALLDDETDSWFSKPPEVVPVSETGA